jgi:transcriptional regulator with GAF, ATPase, and Fis domain
LRSPSLNLIESELFGHEKGSFTGAIRKKIGKFEMANKGSIFLDEIGSVGLTVQIKLLRALIFSFWPTIFSKNTP